MPQLDNPPLGLFLGDSSLCQVDKTNCYSPRRQMRPGSTFLRHVGTCCYEILIALGSFQRSSKKFVFISVSNSSVLFPGQPGWV